MPLRRSAVFGLLTLCLVSAYFLSCNSKKSGSETTIRFWHFWSEPSQKQVLAQLISEFEKKENCKVECTELSWNDGKTKLVAAFSSKTAPDVMEFGSDWVAQFSSSGVLAELAADSMKLGNFIEWSLAPCRWDGHLYAVPWVVDTRVLYVNKGVLDQCGVSQLPSSWIELKSAAERVQAAGQQSGFGANGADGHRLYKKILPFFWSFGGDVLNAKGEAVLNSAQNIEALNLYLELSRSGTIDTQKQLDAAFAQGRLAFWNSGGWLADKIAKENPLLDYRVIAMPGVNGNPGVSFAGGEYLAVASQSTQQQLAQKLVRFLSDGTNALSFCKQLSEAGFPADKRAFGDNYFVSHPIRSVYAQQLQHAKMTPVHPQWLEMESIIENAVVEALYAKKDATQALNDAQYLLVRLLNSHASR